MTVDAPKRAARGRSSTFALIGGAATGLAMFVLNIAVARGLAEVAFADFAFCLVLSQVWLIPTMSGVELAAPRLVATASPAERRSVAGTALGMSLTLGIVASLAGLALLTPIAEITNSTRLLVILAIAFGVATGMRAIAERLVAGIGSMGVVAGVKLLEGALIVAGSAVLVASDVISSWSGAVAIALGAAIVADLAYVGRMVAVSGRPRWSSDARRQITAFARHAAPATVLSVAIVYVDKFALRIAGTSAEYAQYTAYFAGTVLIAVQVVFVLQAVVLPASARADHHDIVATRIRRTVLPLAPVLFAMYVISAAAVIALLGDAFTFGAVVVVFAAWASLFTCNVLSMTAVVARSTAAMRREAKVLAARVALASAVLGVLVARDQASITSVALVMLAAEIAETVNVIGMVRHVLPASADGVHEQLTDRSAVEPQHRAGQ